MAYINGRRVYQRVLSVPASGVGDVTREEFEALETKENRDFRQCAIDIANLKAANEGVTFNYATRTTTAHTTYYTDAMEHGILSKVEGRSAVVDGAIESAFVNNITSTGKNLLNIADVAATTTNGVTYSISNGVITLNGTTSAQTDIVLKEFTTGALEGSYYLKCFFSNGSSTTYRVNLIDTQTLGGATDYGSGASLSAVGTSTYKLFIRINSGVACSNLVFNPMLVRGSTAPTHFEPYKSETLHLMGTVTRNIGIINLGDLNWSSAGNYWLSNSIASLVKKPNSATALANILSENYNLNTIDAIIGNNEGINIYYENGNIIVNNGSSTTTPTGMLYYELATPTTEEWAADDTLCSAGNAADELVLSNNDTYVLTGSITQDNDEYLPAKLTLELQVTPVVTQNEEE